MLDTRIASTNVPTLLADEAIAAAHHPVVIHGVAVDRAVFDPEGVGDMITSCHPGASVADPGHHMSLRQQATQVDLGHRFIAVDWL